MSSLGGRFGKLWGPFHKSAGSTHWGPASSHHCTGGQDLGIWIWGHTVSNVYRSNVYRSNV